MSVSTDGQICYGISFEEDHQFPWDDEKFNGDIKDWWRDVNGFKPPFELYDKDGNYIDGVKPPQSRMDAYFDAGQKWDAAHPLPVSLVNTCSGDCPQYVLAVPSTERKANRGYPEKFSPSDLVVADADVAKLTDFCAKYGIDFTADQLGWWLSSLWM